MNTETALITGASSGIGKELAILFASHGYHLVLVGRQQDRLEELATTLSANTAIKIYIINQDLQNPDAALAIKSWLDEHAIIIDVLVNNAGFSSFGPFFENTLTSQMGIIAVNIQALTALTHLLLPSMIKQGKGKILNIASLAAYFPLPLLSVYSATKSYIVVFSRLLAEELRGSGVHVTVVCPGVTQTDFLKRANIGSHNVNLHLLPSAMSSKKVANLAFKGLLSNKFLVITGFKNKVFLLIASIIVKLFGIKVITALLKK